VTAEGEPDGWLPPLQWQTQTSPGGVTRLVVSAQGDALGRVFGALLRALDAPLAVRYVQFTHRQSETQHVHTERPSWVAVELAADRVARVFAQCETLLLHDGRHQIWVQGTLGDQLILDELGMIYVYPDDPAMRDALAAADVPQGTAQTLLERDYVRVELLAQADAQERNLIESLGLQPFSAL
jgi:hypothetical protein